MTDIVKYEGTDLVKEIKLTGGEHLQVLVGTVWVYGQFAGQTDDGSYWFIQEMITHTETNGKPPVAVYRPLVGVVKIL